MPLLLVSGRDLVSFLSSDLMKNLVAKLTVGREGSPNAFQKIKGVSPLRGNPSKILRVVERDERSVG